MRDGSKETATTAARVTRRGLVMGGGLVAAAAPFAGLVLPASGRAQQPPAPKRGGRIRVAVTSGGPGDTFDPIKMAVAADGFRACQVYNTLVDLDRKLEPVPALAASWQPERSGEEWAFTLLDGVEFHNGKTLEAADVVYSWNRLRGEQSRSVAKVFLSQVAEIVADGKKVVRVRLKTPDAEFPILAALYNLSIVPDGFTDFDNPVGTGPFRMKQFKPSVRTVTARNANYWKSGRPYVDEIEMFLVADQTARLNALLSGDVQIVQGVDVKAVVLLEAAHATVVESKTGLHTMFAMMCDRAPTNDVNVRLALKYGIDRQKILRVVLRGRGQIGNDHPIAPSDPMYCSEIPVRPYDLDKSRFYLKKAGLSSLNLTLNAITDGRGAPESALLYKEMIAPAGINIDVQREPADGYYTRIWKSRPFDTSTWNPRPTANLMLSLVYQSNAELNDTQWKRPDFDKLLVAARGTLDVAKRKQLYCEMQRMINEDGGALVHTFMNNIDATAAKVKGMEPHSAGPLSNYRFAEKVWIDG